MKKPMKKPIKPNKNKIRQDITRQYREIRYCANKNVDYVLTFPCRDCDGSGRIYAPNQRIDPVEFRKLWDKIPCKKCSNGVISKTTLDKIISDETEKTYDFREKLYDRDLKEWNIAQSILKKCTPAEKKFAKKRFNIAD